jgi:hypothetical protein
VGTKEKYNERLQFLQHAAEEKKKEEMAILVAEVEAELEREKLKQQIREQLLAQSQAPPPVQSQTVTNDLITL